MSSVVNYSMGSLGGCSQGAYGHPKWPLYNQPLSPLGCAAGKRGPKFGEHVLLNLPLSSLQDVPPGTQPVFVQADTVALKGRLITG